MFLSSLSLLLLTTLTFTGPVSCQQCRLRAPSKAAASTASPDNPFPSSSPSPGNGTTPSNGTNTNGTLTPLQAFEYGSDVLRGVNIGGWLVLEPWITPTLFDSVNDSSIVDEYTLGSRLSNDTATQILTQHWETWYTESDFADIAAAGINHVRIPVGYWSIPAAPNITTVSPYVPGAYPYLLKALRWANAHGLYVVLDLHGAPGSQNGFDNSGQRTSDPTWGAQGADGAEVNQTLSLIQWLVGEITNGSIAQSGGVSILELLNEPAGFNGDTWVDAITRYWQDGYTVVRNGSLSGSGGNGSESVRVMIHDAFLGVSHWDNFLQLPEAHGVLMDTHQYQVFNDDELAYSQDEHINYTCTLLSPLHSYATGGQGIWTVMGEWSTAMTDCAQWLNGRGVGARWDGSYADGQQTFGSCEGYTGNYSGWSEGYKTFMRRYFEAQADVGEAANGWIYWTWKTESADDWSYKKGVEGGWIPQDPTERMYPGQCDS